MLKASILYSSVTTSILGRHYVQDLDDAWAEFREKLEGCLQEFVDKKEEIHKSLKYLTHTMKSVDEMCGRLTSELDGYVQQKVGLLVVTSSHIEGCLCRLLT